MDHETRPADLTAALAALPRDAAPPICAPSASASAATTSDRSRVMPAMRAALSRYAGSSARKWAYSLTVEPQPLAVMTIASTSPRSTAGHQASISARMSSRPPSWSLR